LERSSDGMNFGEIARIQGNGTTNTLHRYSFTDKSVLQSGVYYYRLSQFDYDGTQGEPKIIISDCDNSSEPFVLISMYPNPVNNILTVSINQASKGRVTINVYDVLGQIVMQKELELTSGYHQVNLDFTELSSAIYSVMLISGNRSISEKVIKQ